MCMGIPMQVVVAGHGWAECRNGDELRRIDTLLLDPVAPGDWVLVHVDSAIRSLEPDEARAIRDALLAVQCAVAGQPFAEQAGEVALGLVLLEADAVKGAERAQHDTERNMQVQHVATIRIRAGQRFAGLWCEKLRQPAAVVAKTGGQQAIHHGHGRNSGWARSFSLA